VVSGESAFKPQERKMAVPSDGTSKNNDGLSFRPQVVNNGIKLVGEVLLPGASELLEGRIARGAAAAGVGLGVPVLSSVVLGPVAALLVGGGVSLGTRLLSYYDSLQPEPWRAELGSRQTNRSAREELDFQYVQGKISEDEYNRKKHALTAS
jgi:hypothetical protein